MTRLMRQNSGYWLHFAALAYVVLTYSGGIAAMLSASWLLNGLGVLLLAHALIIAAYMIHECAHNTVFMENRYNARLGEALSFLVGSAYGDYEDIRHKHFRHHVDRADVVAFDYREILIRHPVWRKVVQALEWAYIPAVDILMHALVMLLPFRLESRRERRGRVLRVLAVRVGLFALLAWVSVKALVLYAVAYMLFLHVIRFMDVHQHTYEIFETLEGRRGEEARRFDRAYEDSNTYSNLVSLRYPWLNLVTLNFGYHNAHHLRPTAPWYELPALHREKFGDRADQVLFVAPLLRSYHHYRVARVMNADSPEMNVADGRDFIGVVGVSFLTAH